MIYREQVKVVLRATGGCGYHEETVISFRVEATSIEEAKHKVEKDWAGMAAAWHEQEGCNCSGILETVFRWDE